MILDDSQNWEQNTWIMLYNFGSIVIKSSVSLFSSLLALLAKDWVDSFKSSQNDKKEKQYYTTITLTLHLLIPRIDEPVVLEDPLEQLKNKALRIGCDNCIDDGMEKWNQIFWEQLHRKRTDRYHVFKIAAVVLNQRKEPIGNTDILLEHPSTDWKEIPSADPFQFGVIRWLGSLELCFCLRQVEISIKDSKT